MVVHLVTFAPSGRRELVDEATTLLQAARRAGLPVASSCRGVGICDACTVRVTEGADNLSETTVAEARARLGRNERLACQAFVRGPVTVTAGYW